MERIRCIDIADINCWIVYLMPFSEQDRADYDKVDQFQKACIKEKIFGMGWKMDDFDEKFGTRMTKEKKECYLEQYQNKGWKISNRALNSYFKIKKASCII